MDLKENTVIEVLDKNDPNFFEKLGKCLDELVKRTPKQIMLSKIDAYGTAVSCTAGDEIVEGNIEHVYLDGGIILTDHEGERTLWDYEYVTFIGSK